jgi:hypothetical protein
MCVSVAANGLDVRKIISSIERLFGQVFDQDQGCTASGCLHMAWIASTVTAP